MYCTVNVVQYKLNIKRVEFLKYLHDIKVENWA